MGSKIRAMGWNVIKKEAVSPFFARLTQQLVLNTMNLS